MIDTNRGLAAVLALVMFLGIVGLIFLILHFLGILVLILAFTGLLLLIGIVLAIVIIGALFIFVGAYYMFTKGPTLDTSGSYQLDAVEGKEDWAKKE